MSLNTWVLGVFATAFGLANGVIGPFDALFIQSFVGIQLVEFFLWRAVDAGASTRAASLAGLALILAQPAASALRLTQADQNPTLGWAIFAAYVAGSAAFMLVCRATSRLETTVGESGHLRWWWVSTSPFVLAAWATALIAPMLFMRGGKNAAGAILGVATLISSCWFFWRDGTWGSIWCWVANVVSLVIIGDVFRRELKACVRS